MEKEEVRRKPFRLKRVLVFAAIGLLLAVGESCYKDSRAIIVAEHDIREWQPQMEKDIPDLFDKTVLTYFEKFVHTRSSMEQLLKQLELHHQDLDMSQFSVEWVDRNTGKIFDRNKLSKIELLRKCNLKTEVEYSRGCMIASHMNAKGNGFFNVHLLRCSKISYFIPIQITVKADSEKKIYAYYGVQLERYDRISNENEKLPGLVGNWLFSGSVLIVKDKLDEDVKNGRFIPMFRPDRSLIRKGASRVYTFEKSSQQMSVTKSYVKVGKAMLWSKKTTLVTHKKKEQ